MKLKERIIHLSGEDYRIVNNCEKNIQDMFLITGLFIPIVFTICCTSCFITFRKVFDSITGVTLLSLFFAWMITNLYRLLLYTFSRNPLPQVDRKNGKFFSRLLQICFVSFIATMIAKPIESTLYANVLDLDISSYKTQAKKSSHYNIVFYYQKQVDEIMRISSDGTFGQSFIKDKLRARRQAILRTNEVINSSEFFLQRLRFLGENHPSCWWITTFFILVFLYPLALKHHLRRCSYYQLKGAYDKRKVSLSYYAFCKKYIRFFEKLHSRKVTFSERYEDSPYNTKLKEDHRQFLTEKEFINELYHV